MTKLLALWQWLRARVGGRPTTSQGTVTPTQPPTPPAPNQTPAAAQTQQVTLPPPTPTQVFWEKAAMVGIVLVPPIVGLILSLLFSFWKYNLAVGGVGVLAATVYLFNEALVTIASREQGVVLRFGRRTGKVIPEGVGFVWPFETVDSEELSIQIRTEEVTVGATCSDGVSVTFKSTNIFRVDRGLTATKFYEAENDKIIVGLRDTTKHTLTTIAGENDSTALYRSREAIALMIDCTMRLQKPPHEDTTLIGPNIKVPTPAGRLAFYKKHRQAIKRILDGVGVGSHSPIEKRLGIDIEQVTLNEVEFGPTFKNALERQRAAEEDRKGRQQRIAQTIETAKSLGGGDKFKAPARDALAAALMLQQESVSGAQLIVSTGEKNPAPFQVLTIGNTTTQTTGGAP